MAEKKQGEEVSVEETGGSKKKLIMIAGGVVLLLVIAGAGLYFTGFFEEDKPPVAEGSSGSDADSAEVKDSAEGGAESEGEVTETLYHALTPPFIVNFPTGNIKIVKVSLSIMAKDNNVIDAVKKHDPIIRNNILMLLSSQEPEFLKSAEGKEKLQLLIKDEINKVLVERKVSSKIKEVFFTDMVMQ